MNFTDFGNNHMGLPQGPQVSFLKDNKLDFLLKFDIGYIRKKNVIVNLFLTANEKYG